MPELLPAPLRNVTVTPTNWRVDTLPPEHPSSRHHAVYITTHDHGYAVIDHPNSNGTRYADHDGQWCYARKDLDGNDWLTWPERHVFDWPTALAVAKKAAIATFEDAEDYTLAEMLRVAPMLPLDLTTDGGTALDAIRTALTKADNALDPDKVLPNCIRDLMDELSKIVGK